MSISRKQFLRNAGLLLGGATVMKQNIFASENFSTCPTDFCSYDLTDPINTPFTSIGIQSCSYGNGITKKTDIKYKKEDANCIPGGNTKCQDQLLSFTYDVYYPIGYDYINCAALPAIIYAHGGAFSDCSDLTSGSAASYCTEFARRGFVTFNVEYRRGKRDDKANPLYTTVQQELASYRALQDVRGAIKSIIKRQLNEITGDIWNDPYRIDISKIFLAGSSAGSVAMLAAAYLPNQTLIDPLFPNKIGTYSIQDVLGPIDPSYYYGSGTSYINNIKGICNMWGSISFPYSNFLNNTETQYLNGVVTPPVISFHGQKDKVFNYKFQNVIFEPAGEYNYDDHCLNQPFFQTTDSNTITSVSYGSQGFFDRVLTRLGVFRELYLDTDMGHGIDSSSNFGVLGTYTTDNIMSYIAMRSTTFFQAIISGSTANYLNAHVTVSPYIHNVFVNSCNKRKKCELFNTDGMTGDSCQFTFQ